MLSGTKLSQKTQSSNGSDTTTDFTDEDWDDIILNRIENVRKEAPVKIRQYAQNVLDYSSQYGSDFSISYTALNITGRPSKYPDYGDFPETFAMVFLHIFIRK